MRSSFGVYRITCWPSLFTSLQWEGLRETFWSCLFSITRPTGAFIKRLPYFSFLTKKKLANHQSEVLPELYQNSADFRSKEELLIVYQLVFYRKKIYLSSPKRYRYIGIFSRKNINWYFTRRRTIGLLSEDQIDPWQNTCKSSVWKSVGLLSKNQQVSHCSFEEYLLIFPSKKIAVFIQIFYQRTYWTAIYISKALIDHWSPTK